MVMVEELYIFYMFTMVHASMFMVEPINPYMYVVMVSFLAGTVLVDMRNITIHHELRLDLWLCVGVSGPMSLHWFPWDALLG